MICDACGYEHAFGQPRDATPPMQAGETLDEASGMRINMVGSMSTTPEPPDPWRGRYAGMRCRTCIYYVPKSPEVGRCRRNAPTIKGYPVSLPSDWCGEHRLDEYAWGPHEVPIQEN